MVGRLERVEGQLGRANERLAEVQAMLQEQTAQHERELAAALQSAASAAVNARAEATSMLAQTQEIAARETASALASAMERETTLTRTLAELRGAMEEGGLAAAEREGELRAEATALEARVRDLEATNHALQSNTSDATKPLLRWAWVWGPVII